MKIEDIEQQLANREAVASHPEHAAAVITLNNLFDLEPFADLWERMGPEDRDDLLLTLADGIQRRATVRERQILLKIASEV
jgi:hypothetical protein